MLRRFEPALEREFQKDYYARIRPMQRVLSLLLGAMFLAYAFRDYSDTRSLSLAGLQDGAPALFFLLLFGLTHVRWFRLLWQPVAVAGSLIAAAVSLTKMGSFLAVRHFAPAVAATAFPGEPLFFGEQLQVLMICMALLRFQFKWAAVLQPGLIGIGLYVFLAHLLSAFPTANDISRFLQPTLAVLVAVLLAAFVEERLARRAFAAARELEEERNDERRKREQTEGKLQVLAQAIGGIVHDLGNPLTTVQMGAETLNLFLEDEAPNKEELKEFAGAILDGAQMLNSLRLSLMEQTRVLEGKPIPIHVHREQLRPIIEAGAHFQSPRFTNGRRVSLVGVDLELCADKMRLITVFMNLIGNALKYSDGEVRIQWQTQEDALSVALLDQGQAGRGISETEARKLFVPFGRLEAHSQVEGTGLGLLSVRKIVEAHRGEIFIEGHQDGASVSPAFTTAQGHYHSMLTEGYLTAFVVVCPLQNTSCPVS